jgi:hypothetical protein
MTLRTDQTDLTILHGNHTQDHVDTNTQVNANTAAIATKAPLASPAFTEVPTAPTAPTGTNTTQIATTAFVEGEVASGLSTPDATTSSKGKIQLAGDLGGTAALPKIKRTTRFIVAPYGDTRPADYTCATTTDNQVEIQAAQVAANALPNGADIELLDGDFVVDAPIVPLSNVGIKGQGMFRTRLRTKTGVYTPVFDFHSLGGYTRDNPLTNFSLTDMEIDGSNLPSDSGNKGIDGANYANCHFRRLYVHDTGGSGIGIDFPTNSIISDNLVVDCGYINKHTIASASWAASIFTFSTTSNHGYSAYAVATGLLTASGIPSDGDTVTLGDLVYTAKTTLSGAAFEVLIGGSASAFLTNLAAAVNKTGTIGTQYGLGTVANPKIRAKTTTSTTQAFQAANYGSSSNSFPTTTTGANLSFGSSTLTGGANGTTVVITGMIPLAYNGTFAISSIVNSTTFTIASGANSDTTYLVTDPGTATSFGFTSISAIGHSGLGIGTNDNYSESLICQNNICVGNQNCNYLIENNGSLPRVDSSSYILSNNISISAGTIGFKNHATQNVQFNNNFDYGAPTACMIETTIGGPAIIAASWSAGVATFQTTTAHSFSVGDEVVIQNMIPTAWNGGFSIITSTPTSDTFTINLASDPGAPIVFGAASSLSRPVEGSSAIDNIFSNNVRIGVSVSSFTEGVMIKNNTVKYCSNYGMSISGGFTQVTGNRVFLNGRQGILLQSGSVSMTRMDVSGNHIYNNGQHQTADGLDVTPNSNGSIQYITIHGNHIFDDQAIPTQRYGINLRDSSTEILAYITISENDLTGNATAPISIQTLTDTIYSSNNVGLDPTGSSDLGNVSGTPTFDITKASYFLATLTGNITPVMPASLVEGSRMTWVLKQDATGGRTITLPANALSSGTINLSATANSIDVITWVYSFSSTKWVEESRALAQPTPIPLRTRTLASVSTVYTPNVDTTDLGLIASPGANFTVANPTGTPVNGQQLQIRITSGASGKVPTWGAAYTYNGGYVLPITALPNSSVITFLFVYNAALATYVLAWTDYASLSLVDLASAQTITGVKTYNTPIALGSGGTGGNSATTARTNLGLVIGTDVEAHDADLTTIAGLSPTDNDIIQRKSGAWTNRTLAQLKTDLGLCYALQASHSILNPLDATTYYIGSGFGNVADTAADKKRVYILKPGNITKVSLFFSNATANGTTETSSISLRLNNTTDTLLSSAVDNSGSFASNVTLGTPITVVAGDYFELKWVTPTWATNPQGLRLAAVINIDQT